MYRAWLDGTLILDPAKNVLVEDPKLTLSDNSSGDFSFTLYDDSPAFESIRLLQSRVVVKRDEETIYEGRVIEAEKSNSYSVYVKTEGALAYLCDSIQRPAEYHNISVVNYFKKLIEEHNKQVGTDKQFMIGTIEITDPNNSLYRYTNWETTLDVIQTDLIKTLGGHLRVRYANGTRYLDCLSVGGPFSTQPIQFGENLLELCQTTDALDLATVCIPLGAKIDKTDTDPAALEKRLTISSVNNGKDYIELPGAVSTYGRVTKPVEFDDVTDPSNLKTKGQQWLTGAQYETLEITVRAVDLADLGITADPWSLLDRIPCKCPAMGLDHTFLLTKKEINLLETSKNTYTLGASGPNFSAQTKSTQKALQKQVAKAATAGEVAQMVKKDDLVTSINDSSKVISAARVDADAIRCQSKPLIWTADSSSLTMSGELAAASPTFSGTITLGASASLTTSETGALTVAGASLTLDVPLYTASKQALSVDIVVPGVGTLSFKNGLLTGFEPEQTEGGAS